MVGHHGDPKGSFLDRLELQCLAMFLCLGRLLEAHFSS